MNLQFSEIKLLPHTITTMFTNPETIDKMSCLKGTVSVISSDPPCKDGNALFTTVPLKHLADQFCGRFCQFSISRNVQVTCVEKPQLKISFQN